jgi:hypothetical protein
MRVRVGIAQLAVVRWIRGIMRPWVRVQVQVARVESLLGAATKVNKQAGAVVTATATAKPKQGYTPAAHLLRSLLLNARPEWDQCWDPGVISGAK